MVLGISRLYFGCTTSSPTQTQQNQLLLVLCLGAPGGVSHELVDWHLYPIASSRLLLEITRLVQS